MEEVRKFTDGVEERGEWEGQPVEGFVVRCTVKEEPAAAAVEELGEKVEAVEIGAKKGNAAKKVSPIPTSDQTKELTPSSTFRAPPRRPSPSPRLLIPQGPPSSSKSSSIIPTSSIATSARLPNSSSPSSTRFLPLPLWM